MKTNYLLLVFVLSLQVIYAQTTYYVDVDAAAGGNGTSVSSAWNKISDVNAATFNPGDQILFNSGDTFYGKLRIPSSGIEGNPIIFGNYGGSDKPIINGRNYIACIDGSGRSYITIQDLELINDSNEDTGIIDTCTNSGCTNGAEQKRYGFYANSANGTREGIVLENLEIHKIYPSTPNGNNEYNGHAIQFTAFGTNPVNYFDGITIQNCELYDTGILGVSVNKWGNQSIEKHKNITVTNNYIHHTGGSGIVYFEVDGFLIENNKITYTGDYSLDTRQRGRGSGFWNVRTSNGLLQYNEFSNANGPKDSCGAHIDIGNDNVIIQYNLSMNNAGGFAEFMGDNTNCIYRYNVSINDGWRVKYDGTLNPAPTIASHPEMFTPKGESNGQVGAAVWYSNYFGPGQSDVPSIGNAVYNNTFYIGTYEYHYLDEDNDPAQVNIPINAFFEFETGTDNNLIQNNIFHIKNGSSLSYFEEPGAIVEKGDIDFNLYRNEGPVDGSMPKWINGVGTVIVNTDESYLTGGFIGDNENFNTNPRLVNPGGTTAEDYKIKFNSPAIDNGKDITYNGGIDYWLNSLTGVPSGDTDIGANERKCDDDTTFSSGLWSSGLPTALDQVIINTDYTLPNDGSFDACQITVSTGATLTIPANEYVNVNGNITVNGSLILQNGGSVVQIDDEAIVNNKGFISVEKETAIFNDKAFTFLGSPMTAETREGVYVNAALVRNHDTSLFTPNPDVENEYPFAENFADDNGDNWIDYNGVINPGEGYLVKPLAIGEADATFTTNYTEGTLTNGIVNVNVVYGDTQNDSPNILSNPYASAVDANEFIDHNSLVDAIYYWEHIEDPTIGYPGYRAANYSMGDISMYNLSGGIAATNHGAGVQSSNRYIPSGQGFAIKANNSGTVTFNNAMRVTENNDGYRNSEEDIDRVYLSISNNEYNLKSGTLIAFSENSTNGYDVKYDAKRLATPVSMYSLNHNMELGIQGRAVFNTDHIIPLGIATQIEETQEYTISLSLLEGEAIENTQVFLQDNELHTITNLTETDYNFTIDSGSNNERFVIVFEPIELGTQDIAQSLSMYPNPVNERVSINSYAGNLQSVTVFDLQGRKVQQWTSDHLVTSVQIDVSHLQSSIYMVKISTNEGISTKRLLKK